jgi:4-alpha-glucanotransferase
MNNSGGTPSIPPFPAEYRASGLLLHVTSLPSPYGIGDLGSSAFSWVSRLRDAGQRWWQVDFHRKARWIPSPSRSKPGFSGMIALSVNMEVSQ